MPTRRSRVRLGGFYALRQSRDKPVKQDMFCPKELEGTFWVEIAWWRVFRFFADGSVAYALFNEDHAKTPTRQAVDLLRSPEPQPLATARRRHHHGKRDGPKAALGSYDLGQRQVSILVQLAHGCMRFEAGLHHGDRGHFVRLDLLAHQQIEPDGRILDHHLPEHPSFGFVNVPEWA